ncbi:MAG: L,D-transpeptidase family protein [Myxococcota bacterium]
MEDAEETGDAEPAPDVRPEDFGMIKPPLPLPEASALTLHGLAGYEVVAVYSEPNLESERLGYLRFGQRVMVTEKHDDQGEGCRKGFHALPMGGFACASKGLIVKADKEPYMYLPPPPPRVDEPLPYDYGTVARDGTPMWWRIADADEVKLADEKYTASLPQPEPKPAKTSKPASPGKTAPNKTITTPLPGLDDPKAAPPPRELTEAEKKELARKEEERKKREEARKLAAAERKEELARKAAKLPLNSSKPFMEKGFMITISERVRDKGRSWWRTTRGGFVEASRAWRRSKNKDFEGGEIPEGSGFPFGFVMAEKGAASAMDDKGALKWKRKLEYREFLDFTEEVDVGGRAYMVTADGLYVRKSDVRLAVPSERPDEIAVWEPWIDVSLEHQILVAYEGDTPVYATLVSTGKKGTKEESFATPKGQWRIKSKHISSSMDGNTASDGAYSIQDVPWTMFFEGSYALHGAFWHSRFGRRRSHGCVNLGPTDARWLFNWTTPVLPEGWHGVKASETALGTMVVVH